MGPPMLRWVAVLALVVAVEAPGLARRSGDDQLQGFLKASLVRATDRELKGDKSNPFTPDKTYRAGMVFLGVIIANDDSGYVYVDPATFQVAYSHRTYWLTKYYSRHKKYGTRSERASVNCETYEETTYK